MISFDNRLLKTGEVIDTVFEAPSTCAHEAAYANRMAKVRERIITPSLPDRGPVIRAQWIAWLSSQPGQDWFYSMVDNFHFGSKSDADAFRHWMMANA